MALFHVCRYTKKKKEKGNTRRGYVYSLCVRLPAYLLAQLPRWGFVGNIIDFFFLGILMRCDFSIFSSHLTSRHINKRQAPSIRAAVPVHTPLKFDRLRLVDRLLLLMMLMLLWGCCWEEREVERKGEMYGRERRRERK